jgi:hypothetical protein
VRHALALGVLAAALSVTPLRAQAPDSHPPASPAAPDQTMRAESDSNTVDAVLDKSVDAKKNKTGDQVRATLSVDVKSGNGVVIPKGSKLVGHITEAKPKAKGDANSQLGIAFDKVIPKAGNELPIHASIRGLSKPQPAMMESGGMPAGPGVQPGLGGPSGPIGGPATPGAPGSAPVPGGRATNGTPQTENPSAETAQDAAGHGAQAGTVPIPGLSIEPNGGDQSGATLITSTTRTVHLDSGTHLALRLATEKQ